MFKHISLLRCINLFRHYVGKYMGFSPKHPLYFSFEPTTACNLSCPECPSGLKQFSRPQGNTQTETFSKLLSEWGKHSWICTFYFQGEPFIHPHIYDLIARAKKAGLYTISSSNGHFFTEKTLPLLAASGLDKLIISVDGIHAESYLKYRVGGDFNRVLTGLTLLSNARLSGDLSTKISVQFIVFRHNEHEIDELQAFMKRFPGLDFLQVKTAQVYGNDKSSLRRLPKSRKYNRYAHAAPQKGCRRMEQGTVVTWDGAVLPCCFDKDGTHRFGNGMEEGFGSAWTSPSADAFRMAVNASRTNHDICANCSEGRRVWV